MQPLITGKLITCTLLFALIQFYAEAQTDADAIMMGKQNFCLGPMYGHSSWKNYWEGTLKRDNLNLGTVSANMYSIMGNYGITNKLNFLFGVPYISTKASAGTMHGDNGIQDLSLWLKWMPLEKKIGKSVVAVYGVGGFSTPLTGYSGDYLPLGIGLHSTNLSARLIADIQHGDFFATASGTYSYRNNVTINRNAYYTTEMHYTDEVEMPDVASFQFRTGYRTMRWIAEAIIDNNNTLGGFDIRRNDMPFPSNKMNWTSAGVNFKYTFKKVPGLSLTGGGSYVLTGRNVGQATQFNGGVFYIFNFAKPAKDKAGVEHSCKLCVKP
ncbi:MAG TPA: hypothetical protein VEV83_16845 [Parafilimonas sp.]|nr:hypothetical protein [Parafilimonas sp.]